MIALTTLVIANVLAVFLTDPTEHRCGLELMVDAGLASGTLYLVLNRLRKAGWVEVAH